MNPAVTQVLISSYNKIKPQIKRRLADFRDLRKGEEEDIFQELCFCLFTPQSKATSCDSAVRALKRKGLLIKGREGAIKKCLKGLVRFHNKKAEYLVGARKLFTLSHAKGGSAIDIKGKLDIFDSFKTREWLVDNVKVLEYKEASHFLRNIGLGKGLAILDVHILKNLKRYGVLKKIPASLTKKTYLEIEEKMRRFSKKIGIPLEELDLLLWASETGFIFK